MSLASPAQSAPTPPPCHHLLCFANIERSVRCIVPKELGLEFRQLCGVWSVWDQRGSDGCQRSFEIERFEHVWDGHHKTQFLCFNRTLVQLRRDSPHVGVESSRRASMRFASGRSSK